VEDGSGNTRVIPIKVHMNSQQTIDAFFKQDGQEEHDKVRRSVLLALQEDLKFCMVIPGKWKGTRSNIKLTNEQFVAVENEIPVFTIISQFCTGIDVLARVFNKKAPAMCGNGKYFIDCAKSLYKLTDDEAKQFWLLRNGISHSYRLFTKQAAQKFGYARPIQLTSNGYWVLYLNAMYTSFLNAQHDLYTILSSESDEGKEKTRKYLEESGFFYTY
jgi:hypothetical protein